MPPLETTELNQKAVLQLYLKNDRYGNSIVDSPIEIDVRWNYGQKWGLDPNGTVIALEATVVVDRKIPLGSRMWLGELVDFLGTGSDKQDSSMMEVKTYKEVQDIKGRSQYREVGLMRWHDK